MFVECPVADTRTKYENATGEQSSRKIHVRCSTRTFIYYLLASPFILLYFIIVIRAEAGAQEGAAHEDSFAPRRCVCVCVITKVGLVRTLIRCVSRFPRSVDPIAIFRLEMSRIENDV